MNDEKFLDKLRELGFKPQVGHCKAAKVLIYKTGFYLVGDYKMQVLSGLYDLRRLIEVDIEKIEALKG